MREFMGEALRANGVGGECLDDILTAASEACANVVDHGDPAPSYEVLTRIRHESCVMEIVNTGPDFDPASVPLPDLEAESGRGILLMRGLMDRVTFDRSAGGGTVVRLHKRLRDEARVPSRIGRRAAALC
ncbi:serine/threonine-protein kinase RsbW [Spinactinospora alkalitolerans]|uniref:Serine/threonine-protein kinase RsbW n=1 Tax=Spinactinospora alkalitolerans TaxID=687207 RepID=A0A852TS41_9ACTN|nr:ATP-binding protein [Spinactinospora alkalitolerans]NYE44984.1 serine/threonine-protein kinase RsbW [Spinactinospora alkalitolerans]